ncbi:PhzF family phenazine biosynthesis isomerase [Streptomyces sp. CAU 1734]|uniref:PhzF family phenazine biosynthesis protein n=1 Tax=Streptomyces sp. CAU 1734 TaxID=3140360 RepID=UPI0032607CE8
MTMVRFDMVNMFADQPFSGSRLAVVPEADGLPSAYLHTLAAEIGTPETVFVLPPEAAGADYRVRVFTPAGETPFGGHSALGTAVTMVRLGLVEPGTVVQQCGSRLTPVTAGPGGGTVAAAGPVEAREPDLALLTAAAGIAPAAVVDAPVRTAGFGPAFHYLPVRPGAVEGARPDLALMDEHGLPDVMVFSWDPAARVATARVFAPGYGMPEDPACASNALGLGEWLVAAGRLPEVDGTHEYVIAQGAGGPRGAVVTCTVTVEAGRVARASAGGRVIPVARGEICAGPPGGARADRAGTAPGAR